MLNWLFRIFVFLLPAQLAYHFWPEWAFIFGIRVDYLAPAIYLTDLLFLALLVFSFTSKKINRSFKRRGLVWVAAAFFVLVNVLEAVSPPAALFKWGKILELFLVFLFVKKAKGLSFERDFLKPLLVSSAFFSIIGLIQFLKGETLGGFLFFLGERSFNLLTPGISLVKIFGRDYLRPYSTFSHPNSFAGFLSVVFLLVLTQKKKLFSKNADLLLLTLVVVGIMLSFSLGAWLSLLISLFFYKIVGRKKINLQKIIAPFLLTAISLSLLFPLTSSGKSLKFSESVAKRRELALVAEKMAQNNPIFGVGLNNFIINLPRFSVNTDAAWFLQPVHNIYLLVFAETGVLGLIALFYFFKAALETSARKHQPGVFLSICFIAIVGAIDHYFLTLQQNLLLFSLLLGYSLKNNED